MLVTYQRCTRCVMDTTDPDISFLADGTCNHCNDYLIKTAPFFDDPIKSEHDIKQLFSKIKQKRKNQKYDSIVGLSGGVDSCYTAYIAKRNGLTPLLVHIDNGWDSEEASKNIQLIAEKLELDLITVSLDWEEFREIQLSFLRSSIVDTEIPVDLAIPAILHDQAKKQDVKAILVGGNYASEGILPLSWGYHVMKDMKLYRYILQKFCSIKRRKTPGFGLWKEFVFKIIFGIKVYYPLNYISYNKDEAKQVLENELKCTFPIRKHHESVYTRYWQAYVVPKKYGFDYRLSTYSTQICSKQLTREQALELLKKPSHEELNIESDRAYICNKLAISASEFEEFMDLAPKTYKDFPNSKKTINFVYGVYRFLFKKK